MKISIIIPVYNGAEFIKQRFKELEAYKNKEAEFIFVNDGSTDDSLLMLSACDQISGDPRVLITTYPENKGSLYARKFGVELAKYDNILMTDIDDPFSFSYLEGLQFDIDSKLPETMIPVPKQIFIDGKPNGQVWTLPQYKDPFQYIVGQFINHSGLVPINNTILKRGMLLAAMKEVRQLLQSIKVKRMDYGEDSLTANVMIQCKLVKHIIPSTVYSVPYTLDNQKSQSKDNKKRMRDLPVLIAHAYYLIFSEYGEEDAEIKAESRKTFEDVCRAKYKRKANGFIYDVDKYVKRMELYYESGRQ